MTLTRAWNSPVTANLYETNFDAVNHYACQELKLQDPCTRKDAGAYVTPQNNVFPN